MAALIGDTVNYYIGHSLLSGNGSKEEWPGIPVLRNAQEFLAHHGIKAVALGRFVPAHSTFVPLIAGTMQFPFHRFTIAKCWRYIMVAIGAGCGYYFGTIPGVRQHFTYHLSICCGFTVRVGLLPYQSDSSNELLERNRML